MDMRESKTGYEENLVSGNVKSGHFQKFFKQVLKQKSIGMLVYLSCLVFIGICMLPAALSEYGILLGIPYWIFAMAVFLFLFQLILNGLGQACMRLIVGASKIERQDMIERIKIPVQDIISEARQNGLTLPDDIEVYQLNSSEAVTYAIGMNSIAVSLGMTELPEDVFKAKILAELYRIHVMDPDYLLFMLGSNVVSIVLGAIVAVVGFFYMFFGDRRDGLLVESETKTGALAFFGSVAVLSAWLGICFLFIRGAVRTNNFDADIYAAQCGYGEALCVYIDNCLPKEASMRLKLLELGHPSGDNRIAVLQKAGVEYRGI